VYLATRDDATDWAIKLLDPLWQPATQSYALDPARCRAQFERECRLLSTLDHPRIPHCEDVLSTPDGQPALVMPYISGETLTLAVAAVTFAPARALAIAVQVCDILAYLHKRRPRIVLNPCQAPRLVGNVLMRVNLLIDTRIRSG
jgi:serine/threonine protein kinase